MCNVFETSYCALKWKSGIAAALLSTNSSVGLQTNLPFEEREMMRSAGESNEIRGHSQVGIQQVIRGVCVDRKVGGRDFGGRH